MDDLPIRDGEDVPSIREADRGIDLRAILGALVRAARSRGLDWQQAEDVAQDAMLTYLQRRDEVREPIAFLRTVVARRAVDCVRREQSEAKRRAIWGERVDGEELVGGDLRLELESALRDLPVRSRRLLRARLVLGCTEEEAANLVGLRPSSVKTTVARAIAKLRALLAGEG